MSASFSEYKRRFRSQPTINPETNRSIKINSDTYNSLVEKYGLPNKRSPAKRSPAKRSPVKRSPAKRSPVKQYAAKRSPSRLVAESRSPMKKESVDMFAVLSPESIRNVFNKLSNEHKQAFLDSSAHVRNVMGY